MKKLLRIPILFIAVFSIATSRCDDFEIDEDLENAILDELECSENESQGCQCLDNSDGVQFCDKETGSSR